MSDGIPITIHVAPDVLAFLEAEAQQATEKLKHAGQYEPGRDVPVEAMASVLLERTVRGVIEDDVRNVPDVVIMPASIQEDIDHGTAAHVAKLLATGEVDKAHELAKTIETPTIRQEVDPNI